jgi:hypothetical protein
MKIAALSATALAVVTAGAVATPSFAQDYGYYGADAACHDSQHNSGTTGAVIGGIAGALIGSNLASHHGGRTGGAALGAVAGALVGNSIGRSRAKESNACDGRDYGRVTYRERQSSYGGDYYRSDYGRSDYGRSDYRSYRSSGYDPYSY